MPFNGGSGLWILFHKVGKALDLGLTTFFNIGFVEVELHIQLYPNRINLDGL
jgi:hypothetical protein